MQNNYQMAIATALIVPSYYQVQFVLVHRV